MRLVIFFVFCSIDCANNWEVRKHVNARHAEKELFALTNNQDSIFKSKNQFVTDYLIGRLKKGERVTSLYDNRFKLLWARPLGSILVQNC